MTATDRPTRENPAERVPGGRELAERLAFAYGTGWIALFAMACACALLPSARWIAQHALALDLHAHIRPAPPAAIDTFGSLLITNLRATAWPLVPGALGAERSRSSRWLVDSAVLISVALNLLPVGAALGIYRRELVPYLPHLPLELYAITAGPATWLLIAHGRCSARQLPVVAASISVALAGAAFLETWAVPQR